MPENVIFYTNTLGLPFYDEYVCKCWNATRFCIPLDIEAPETPE